MMQIPFFPQSKHALPTHSGSTALHLQIMDAPLGVLQQAAEIVGHVDFGLRGTGWMATRQRACQGTVYGTEYSG